MAATHGNAQVVQAPPLLSASAQQGREGAHKHAGAHAPWPGWRLRRALRADAQHAPPRAHWHLSYLMLSWQ